MREDGSSLRQGMRSNRFGFVNHLGLKTPLIWTSDSGFRLVILKRLSRRNCNRLQGSWERKCSWERNKRTKKKFAPVICCCYMGPTRWRGTTVRLEIPTGPEQFSFWSNWKHNVFNKVQFQVRIWVAVHEIQILGDLIFLGIPRGIKISKTQLRSFE
jgi:hypothetical protein